jgi:hypothetical protein
MEIKWEKADAATIKAFAETGQKPAVETAREFAEAEANYRVPRMPYASSGSLPKTAKL